MSENKIPTDEDILKEYYSEGSNGGDYISNLTESDTLLWLIKKARAAGREEQRERDAVILEKRAEQLKTHKDFENGAYELELQAKIIRAQRKEKK